MALPHRSVVLGLSLLGLGACNTTANRSSSRVLDATTAVDPNAKTLADLQVARAIKSSGDFMCFGAGALWEPSGGGLNHIDPAQQAVTATVPVTVNWCAAAPGSTTVWALSCFDGKLYRIDAASNQITGTYTVPASGGSEGSFAVTNEGVWIVTSNGGTDSGTLTKLDPATGQVLADIKVANDSHGVAATGGFVWVSSLSGNTVTQVDAKSNAVVSTIPTDAGPNFITAGDGGVWTLNEGKSTVTHIDATTGKVVATIETGSFPGGGGDISVGEGAVWVARFDYPVMQIDEKTDKVVMKYGHAATAGDDYGDALRAGGGYLWVSGGTMHQITPPNQVPPNSGS